MNTESELKLTQNVSCDNCNAILTLEEDAFLNYFKSSSFTCAVCNNEIDFYQLLIKQIASPQKLFGWHYSLIGCIGESKTIILKPTKLFKLDLSETIQDGELLHISYTPRTLDLFPIQQHGNIPMPHMKQKIFSLIPYELNKNPADTEIQIFFWYAPKEVIQDLPTTLLLDAFIRYYEDSFRHMIISAQTSIEILSNRFFDCQLRTNNIGKDRRTAFLEEKATFSVQVFTLLPWIASVMKFPIPEERVITSFKWLVEDRNKIVHTGIPKKDFNEERLQKELISAFILFRYFKILPKMIDQNQKC